MLAAYLAGDTSIGLKDLGFTKLGVQMTPITDLIGKRSQPGDYGRGSDGAVPPHMLRPTSP